jgi:membrane-bound lytic murein transglycosylase D
VAGGRIEKASLHTGGKAVRGRKSAAPAAKAPARAAGKAAPAHSTKTASNKTKKK